ncbi:LysM peptidoglycan-binding domain-containing protein [Humibacillus xanthopallidus]|uniref:LysM domain-containing protein n=1 Tax=Humibacillus xanthopallidus TaxID=412689 RepID=A0A543HXD7_9MICO|nr:LysM peptidoglycan-binding domain-containing protein [Humibacillus xanthopallidus]TQM63012.1 LysM domain-containing protein [Humibacillus xanthopallidus]
MPFAADVATLVTPPHAVVAAPRTTWSTVTVRSGDTLWDLAITHRTTVAAIVAKNRLPHGGAVIHVGQKLLVPGKGAATPAAAARPAARPAAKPTAKPTVRPAAKPAAATKPTRKPATTALRTYVVRSGDTMSGIAKRYTVSVTALLAANHLSASSYIYVGQRITVPTPGASGQPARKPFPKPSSKPGPKPAPKPSSQPAAKPTASTARAQAVAASKAKLAAMTVPSRTETADLIRSIATRHGVDPKLALAIGWLESGWYQRAVSSTNAVGVMQIMPITGTWASQLAGRKLDLYDVRDNITAGVLVLRALQTMADSSDQAIAAYYQGLYSVRTRGLYTDTKAYVASVKAIYARL